MLGVAMHITIKTLFESGYSKSKIAEIVGCSRKTSRQSSGARGSPADRENPAPRMYMPYLLEAKSAGVLDCSDC